MDTDSSIYELRYTIYALLAEDHRWVGVKCDRINAEAQRTRRVAEGAKNQNEDESRFFSHGGTQADTDTFPFSQKSEL
jgi:hypothetical protein